MPLACKNVTTLQQSAARQTRSAIGISNGAERCECACNNPNREPSGACSITSIKSFRNKLPSAALLVLLLLLLLLLLLSVLDIPAAAAAVEVAAPSPSSCSLPPLPALTYPSSVSSSSPLPGASVGAAQQARAGTMSGKAYQSKHRAHPRNGKEWLNVRTTGNNVDYTANTATRSQY